MALTNSSAQLAISAALNQSLNLGVVGSAVSEGLTFPATNTTFGVGNGTSNFNNGFCQQQVIANGTPLVYNLSSSPSVTQIDGTTMPALNDIVAFAVKNVSGNGTITIGGGTDPITTMFTGNVTLPPGASVCILNPAASGFAITATSADRITLTNSAGNNTCAILALGH